MRISDWSSDVCSSDLGAVRRGEQLLPLVERREAEGRDVGLEEAHRMRVEGRDDRGKPLVLRSEEHTSELQSLMRISYAVFCLKKKTHANKLIKDTTQVRLSTVSHFIDLQKMNQVSITKTTQ